MLTRPPTLYDILGVEPNAPIQKIRAIYRLRTREAHPDLGSGNGQLQTLLNEAYEILSNPQKRQEYNEQIKLHSQPRPIKPGRPMYQEIVISHQDADRPIAYTFKRWEPCHRCWGEGCTTCQGKGKRLETIKLSVTIPTGVSQHWIKGQGVRAEPSGSRGDLILYVIWQEEKEASKTKG